MPDLSLLVNLLQLAVKERTQLALENIALRHQLAVYKRSVKRPRIEDSKRFEIDPRCMDVVIGRWQEATGEIPQGASFSSRRASSEAGSLKSCKPVRASQRAGLSQRVARSRGLRLFWSASRCTGFGRLATR